MEKQEKDLLLQLAQANAEKEKYKAANDKLCKSEAEMRRQLKKAKAMHAYKSISDEKVVESLIQAVSEADHNTIATILESEIKAATDLVRTKEIFKTVVKEILA